MKGSKGVEKVKSVKILYREILKDLENLHGALSRKAFRGDLDLSRIPSRKTCRLPTMFYSRISAG